MWVCFWVPENHIIFKCPLRAEIRPNLISQLANPKQTGYLWRKGEVKESKKGVMGNFYFCTDISQGWSEGCEEHKSVGILVHRQRGLVTPSDFPIQCYLIETQSVLPLQRDVCCWHWHCSILLPRPDTGADHTVFCHQWSVLSHRELTADKPGPWARVSHRWPLMNGLLHLLYGCWLHFHLQIGPSL